MAGSRNKAEIIFLEPWHAEMRLSVLFLLPGVSSTSALVCRAVFWWLWCSCPGWRLVLPQGHKQKVVCVSPRVLLALGCAQVWAGHKLFPVWLGRCFAPNGIRWEEVGVAPWLIETTLLLKRDDYRVRQHQEGIWGQSRCFFYNSQACHILAFLFLPTFPLILYFIYYDSFSFGKFELMWCFNFLFVGMSLFAI